MEPPDCIKLLRDGYYTCVCGERFEDEFDTHEHMSTEYPGYCVNGIKRSHDDIYVCLCGKSGMTRQYARYTHVWENKGKCFMKQLMVQKTYCEICSLQCDSVAAYERHIGTKRHNEMINPTKISVTCFTCNVTFRSQNQIKDHLETKKHKDREEHGGKINLTCELCGITCPSQKTMRTHLQTKKHLKRVTTNALQNK